MKKRVNAELISIAHRILKLKDASDTIKLQQEAKNLYDQLTILRFYEENFENFRTEIPQEVLEEKLDPSIKTVFDAPIPVGTTEINSLTQNTNLIPKNEVIENEVIESQVIENEVIENEVIENEVIESEVIESEVIESEVIESEVIESEVIESEIIESEVIENEVIEQEEPRIIIAELVVDEDDLDEEEPISDLFTRSSIATESIPETSGFPIEDLTAHDYSKMDFVKVETIAKEQELVHQTLFEETQHPKLENEVEKNAAAIENEVKTAVEMVQKDVRPASLNDILNKIISFGLNDRIGFEKKLFNGNPNDFNRVVSQLNTFDSFDEAKSFVDSFVKPDYNNWEGCEEYEARFMEIVAKKFL